MSNSQAKVIFDPRLSPLAGDIARARLMIGATLENMEASVRDLEAVALRMNVLFVARLARSYRSELATLSTGKYPPDFLVPKMAELNEELRQLSDCMLVILAASRKDTIDVAQDGTGETPREG